MAKRGSCPAARYFRLLAKARRLKAASYAAEAEAEAANKTIGLSDAERSRRIASAREFERDYLAMAADLESCASDYERHIR